MTELLGEETLGDLAEAPVRVPFDAELQVLRRAAHAHENTAPFLPTRPQGGSRSSAARWRVVVVIDVQCAERRSVGDGLPISRPTP